MARELDPEPKDVHDRLIKAMTDAAARLDKQGRGRAADGIREAAARSEMSMAEYLGEFDEG